MTGFAYVVRGDHVDAIGIEEAIDTKSDLTWIHLTTGSEEAQAWLRDRAGLSDFVVEALTALETRPRCDAVGEGAVINLRGLSSEAVDVSDPLVSIRLYATGGCVFSVTRRQLNALAPVRKLVERGAIRDPGDLITEIATAITEELDPMVADLGDSLDDCEEKLSAERAFTLRRRVNRIRVRAVGYRRFLAPQRAALEKLAGVPGAWLNEDDRLHINSAADRAARMAEEVESIRERAALTHETLTDLRAEQIDQRSLIIAIAAMVFLPLTFLTGLFGMNVEIPFAHEHWAFWFIVGLSAAMAIAIAAYFIRRRWVRG